MYDRNRELIDRFDEILRLCGGDYARAEAVHAVLRRTHRYERYQEERRRMYPIAWIGGEPVRLKHRYYPKEAAFHETTED
jgi:hypothetical protein